MFFKSVPFPEKILFAKNLGLMIKAGLPLREGVATIRDQSKNKSFKKVLDEVIGNIDNGQSLAASLARHPSVFDSLYINMIKVGEESGTLEESFNHLTLQLEKSAKLKGKVKQAMIYPAIIIIAVIVLGTALTLFVLPQIIPVFKALDVELPLATRILIKVSEVIQNYGFFVLLSIILLIIVFTFLLRIRAIKFLFDKLTLKLPIIGSIFRSVSISHFSRTLGVLLRSGIPVVGALDITKDSLGNLVYQKELEGVESQVKRGRTISNYLKKEKTLFPLMVSRTIGVGEKTGNLEETLIYLGDFYEAEVDKSVKSLSTILEPILLLAVGFAVGFIAIAIISPIYELTSGLHI